MTDVVGWTWLAGVGNHLWQSSLVAATVWGLARYLHAAPATVRHRLLVIASAKFALPFAILAPLGEAVPARGGDPSDVPAWFTMVAPLRTPPTLPAMPVPDGPVPQVLNWLSADLIPLVLGVVWVIGMALHLGAWAVHWHRAAALVRRGRIDGAFTCPVPVVASPEVVQPGLFGVRQPILLWPTQLAEHLTAAQTAAVVAHEVSHLHRRDNLIALCHTAIETVFWFYPVVRWIGARLVEERERACDETVIGLGHDPTVYAEALVRTQRFSLTAPPVWMAGVTSATLSARVAAIMDRRTGRPLSPVARLVLAVVGAMSGAARTQSTIADAPARAFDVASVTVSTAGPRTKYFKSIPAGRFEARGVTLRELVAVAFGGGDRPLQALRITGGPRWLDTARFDIQAHAEDENQRSLHAAALRTLLTDRFALATHIETRELPVYTVTSLTPTRLGPQLKPSNVDCEALRAKGELPSPPAAGKPPRCGIMMGIGFMAGGGVPMSELLLWISRWFDRVVIDRTDVSGALDFELSWAASAPPPPAGSVAPPPPIEPPDSGPSLVTAIREQWGLKVESTRAPVQVLVIDSARPPSPD